jgi:hypothetical protein
MIKASVFVLIVSLGTVSSGCRSGSGTGAPRPAPDSPPAGWTTIPTPLEGSEALQCANYSRQEWRVSLSAAGAVQITEVPQRYKEVSAKPELPAGVKLQKGMVGNLSSLRVQNGWLLGFGVSHPSAKDRGMMGHLRFVVRSRAAQRADCVFHWESDSKSIRLRHGQVHCCLTRSLAYADADSGHDDAGAGSAA